MLLKGEYSPSTSCICGEYCVPFLSGRKFMYFIHIEYNFNITIKIMISLLVASPSLMGFQVSVMCFPYSRIQQPQKVDCDSFLH